MKSTLTLKDFIIKFKGLSTGVHRFDYNLDDAFFQEIGDEDLQGGNVDLQVLLLKENTMLTFDIILEGSVVVVCDRCLDNFDLPLEGKEKFYVKFDESSDSYDDVIHLSEEEYQINLFERIRGFIIISLPMQKIHPDDIEGKPTCNPDMLLRIKALENTQEDKIEEIDPRWNKLKEIHL